VAAFFLAGAMTACTSQVSPPHEDEGGAGPQNQGDAGTMQEPGDGAECGPSIVTYVPAGTPDCWPCSRDACGAEAQACAADCTCNMAVGQSLACVAMNDGKLLASCFNPFMPLVNSNAAFGAVVMCLLRAEPQCCMSTGNGGLTLLDASPG
jgi:hypothetical protein